MAQHPENPSDEFPKYILVIKEVAPTLMRLDGWCLVVSNYWFERKTIYFINSAMQLDNYQTRVGRELVLVADTQEITKEQYENEAFRKWMKAFYGNSNAGT